MSRRHDKVHRGFGRAARGCNSACRTGIGGCLRCQPHACADRLEMNHPPCGMRAPGRRLAPALSADSQFRVQVRQCGAVRGRAALLQHPVALAFTFGTHLQPTRAAHAAYVGHEARPHQMVVRGFRRPVGARNWLGWRLVARLVSYLYRHPCCLQPQPPFRCKSTSAFHPFRASSCQPLYLHVATDD